MADKLLEFFALNQFFSANIEDKRAVGHTKQAVNLIDADIAILGCFTCGQCHL